MTTPLRRIRTTLICGRKFCSRCSAWRHACDYTMRSWDADSPYGFHLSSYCNPCRRREVRDIYHEQQKHDKEWVARKREYDRIYMEAKRREAGSRERQFHNRKGRIVDLPIGDNLDLPIEPFACWVEEKVEQYGGIETFARAAGYTDSRPIRSVVARWADGKPKRFIRLDTVDRVLTAEGSTLLQELYPSLYPELEQVA